METVETVRINPDGSTDNATSNTWYDANGFVSNTTQVQNGNVNDPNVSFNRAFVNDAQGHAVYVNQGAGAGGNSSNPNIDTAVNGRIQNLAGGYLGGWIGNRTSNPGHVQHQLVVAGEVLARYGDAADKSAGAGTAPAFAPVAELYLSAPGSALHEGNADPVAHTVVQGETLQSIARSTLGDSRLWYRIAQANGLSVQPDKPLQAGVTLSIPKATLSANSASTFKPYDPSRVIGDANPALNALPVPQGDDGGCGGFGQILVLAIIIAATIYSAGALAASGALGADALGVATLEGATTGGGLGATFAAGGSVLGGGAGVGTAIAAGAVSSALGSVAGQTFGIATGMQQDFDWRSVGLAALSGGVSGGLAGFAPLVGDSASFGNLVTRAAVGSALTQGIAVATGLQRSFSWTNVAASAIGAGVGYGANEALGLTRDGIATNAFSGADKFGRATLGSLAASTATALAHGGRVSITQIGVNAFGQSIGSSLAEQAMMGGTQEDRLTNLYSNDGDLARSELRFNPNAPNYSFATTDGLDSGFAGTFGTALPRDSSNDVMVADARDKLRLNVVSDSDENFYSNIIGRHQASEARRQAARAQANQALGQRLDRASPIRSGSYGGEMPYDVGYAGDASAANDAYTGMGLQLTSQLGLNLQSISQGLNPGAGMFDNFNRGFTSNGNDFSVLEGDKPFSYSLGGAARTGLGLVVDGLVGAGDFSATGQAFQRGEYVSASMYGARGLGTVGLTAMTLGQYALAKAGVAGVVGSSGIRMAEESLPVFSRLSQPGGLMATEGNKVIRFDGRMSEATHPLSKHGAEVSDQYVFDRVTAELASKNRVGLRTAFNDRMQMENSIAKTLGLRRTEIETWISSGPRAGVPQAFEANPGMGNLGRGYQITSKGGSVVPITQSMPNVNLVLIPNGRGGYLIHTAHPF